MVKVITDSTNTTTTKVIQFTLDEVIEALAVKAGVTAPDFDSGEADSAKVKRYSMDANGDAANLWSTDTRGDGVVYVLDIKDQEVV